MADKKDDAKKDDDKKDVTKQDEVREDQLLADEAKKKEELEKLDAKEDKADGKGDPAARLADAGKDGESAGMYRMDEKEHMRSMSKILNTLDDHQRRLSGLEGAPIGADGRPGNPVQPVGLTDSMINKMLDGMLSARDIAKDFKSKYPDKDIGSVTMELIKKGLNPNDVRHGSFLSQLSMEQNPGELYNRLNERPDLIEDLVTLHPTFHDRILNSLKRPVKGTPAPDVSAAPAPVEAKTDAKPRQAGEDMDKIITMAMKRRGMM